MKWRYFLLLLFLPMVYGDNYVMNTSVQLAPNLNLTISGLYASYCPGDIINVSTQITNIGNQPATFNFSQVIYDQYSNVYVNESRTNQHINPAQEMYFLLSKTVAETDSPGVYSMYSLLNYSSTFILKANSFRKKQGYGTLVSSPSFIEETVFPGDLITKDLYLWLLFPCYGTQVSLNASGETARWTYFSTNPVYLPPETWNVTKILVFVDLPWNTLPGDYQGNIIATISGVPVLTIPVIIHVQTTAIFDVQTEVLSQYKEVCKGDEVKAKITLLKVFPPEKIDVNMTYLVQFGNQSVDQKKETIAVENSLEKIVALKIPSSASEGLHTFYGILDADYKNWKVNISSYDTFHVISCQPQPTPPSVSGGGGVETYPLEKAELKEIEIRLTKYKILATIGNLTSFTVKLKNKGEANVTDIKLQFSGIPLEWVTVSPYKITNLATGQEAEFLVFVKTPLDAKPSVYQFSIKAKNTVESNEEKALLILSTDEKELTRMLYEEAAKVKEDASKTISLTCLNISEVKALIEEADMLFDMAKDYMEKEDYKMSQEVFLEAIDYYELSMKKAEILMEERYSKIRDFNIPPFSSKLKSAKAKLETSYKEKNYDYFCPSLNEAVKYTSYILVEIAFAVILVVAMLAVAYSRYKRYKEMKFEEKLKEIKKRLDYEK